MSTLKGTAPKSGLAPGGYTTAWRLTVESNTLEDQEYGQLVQLYGDQLRMWDLLMLANKFTDVKGRTVKVLEEGAILDTVDVGTEVATGAAGADITVVSTKGGGRVGFSVGIPAKYTGLDRAVNYKITARTYSAPNYTYTLSPWNDEYQITVAIPVGQKLYVGASAYAPGTGQPAAQRRSWYSHTHKTRIMKETVDIEGGQQALQEYVALAQAKDGSTLVSRSLNEAEFRMRVQWNDHLLMGEPNENSFTGDNAASETNALTSDYGLIPGMLESDTPAMKQYYTGSYGKDNFDVVKFLLASQGVGSGSVWYAYGQELGLSIENSGLTFIQQFSAGTDLKKMQDVGFVMKSFTKNGVVFKLAEIPELSNPLMYGADGYNFETMGMIFPDAKITGDITAYDNMGRALGASEKKPLSHVHIGYLNNNGENRKLVVGDVAGVNGLGYKFTNEYDKVNWYMLSETMTFLMALNQSIIVLKTD